MTADYLREAEEASTKRPERAEDQPRSDANGQQASPRSSDLLGDGKLRGRANEPVRVALMQDMQRTQGNRAVQRFVQRSAAATSATPDEEIGSRIRDASGSGSNLDSSVQRKLESGLGADLSNVQVHTDSEADNMARSVDSVAFTSGQDIFFREGAYNPSSKEGMHLLAHEAAHTMQQAQGPVEGTPAPGGVSISDPSDKHEQEADRMASGVMSGGVPAVQKTTQGQSGQALQRQPEEGDEEEPKKKPEEEEAAVQAMRTGRYPSVQRALFDSLPSLEEVLSSAPVTASENTVEGAEGAAGSGPGAAAEAVESSAGSIGDLTGSVLAGILPAVQEAKQERNQSEEKSEAEQRLDENEERIDNEAQNAERSAQGSQKVVTAGNAATLTSNSALRGVFEGSVVTPLHTAHDNLVGSNPDAQTAWNQVDLANSVSGALAETYRSQGDMMLGARLAALSNSTAAEIQVLQDHFATPISLDQIGKDLDPTSGWFAGATALVVPQLHTPQQSSGQIDAPPNPALQAIYQAAVVNPVASAHGNLLSDRPDAQQATTNLERAMVTLQSLIDAYRSAGDDYMAEELATIFSGLQADRFALIDHDPSKLLPLRILGERWDPDTDPIKNRIVKIEDELH